VDIAAVVYVYMLSLGMAADPTVHTIEFRVP